ncbi:MAG: hypothetical protein KIS87_04970 [Phycisphaeraceae bacterium]|nr:hypothetical protein [Phycisphaeraceae bacterium]
MTAPDPVMSPTLIRTVGLLGAFTCLIGVVGAILALLSSPPVWFAVGFQTIIALTGLLTALMARSRTTPAPSLALVCFAGAVFTSATLGRFSAVLAAAGEPIGTTDALLRLLRDPWFLAQNALAGLLGAIAIFTALGRDPRTWRKLSLGLVCAVPVVAAAGWVIAFNGDEVILAPVDSALGIVRVVVVCLACIAAAILLSISAHLVIGAFSPTPEAPAKPDPRPTQ